MKKIVSFFLIFFVLSGVSAMADSSNSLTGFQKWAQMTSSQLTSLKEKAESESNALQQQISESNAAIDAKNEKLRQEKLIKDNFNKMIMIIFLISILSIAVIVLIILKRKGVIFKKPMNIKKLAKTFSAIFFIAFIISVISTTIFFIPKYATYRDGNTKELMGSGYYNIAVSHKSFWLPTYVGNNHAYQKVDLQIDYGQWAIIAFAECAVLLLPAGILYKSNRTKAPN